MRIGRIAGFVLAVVLGCAGWARAAEPVIPHGSPETRAATEPVNPHASPEARALLATINAISGQGTISGQHNFPNDASRWTDLAYDLTAKYPGLFGQDFGFAGGDDKDSVLARPAMIEEAERQWRNGAVIALTWHAVRPTEDEPVTFRDSVQGHLTDYEWHELLTPGSPLYLRWCAQVDVIAGYLRVLRDAHVPVLFRPYHEMNGNWFWWGGRPGKDGSAALYRQVYDRMVNVHHLDNLVWVWNVNSPSGNAGAMGDYYPGAAFADVVTMDIYGEFKQEFYQSMMDLAAGKPIALAEVGGLPSPEVLEKQPRWAYFMAWSGMLGSSNTGSQVNAVYHSARVVNRDDARLAGPMEAIRKATAERTGGAVDAEPVSPGASAEARALLGWLLVAPGKGLLSGQENDSAAPGAATASVAQAVGKRPAIWAAALEGSVESRETVVTEAVRAAAGHAVVSLSWMAPRPTDGVPATATAQLTDYEWDELLTDGSALNKIWCAQVDDVAATLRELEKAGIAVLWNPYPKGNGKDYWWAGRKGGHGSAELYRRLFDRVVNHDGLHNMVWVWEAGMPAFGPGGTGRLSDYFPGLLYADALEIAVDAINPRFGPDRFLAGMAPGKVLGVELNGEIPAPEALTQRAAWAWFVAGPQADSGTRVEEMKKLYADARVVSLTPAQ